MVEGFIADESGAIALVMAFLLVAFLGLGALAVDIGCIASGQDDLKKAAEAGALAGAAALGCTKDWYSAATSILQKNGLSGCEVQKGYWSLVQKKFLTTAPSETPSPVSAIRVVAARNVQLSFAPILGINSKDLTGTAVAVLRGGGSGYTLFSGNDLTISNFLGYFNINGSVFSNGNMKLTGFSIGGINITGSAAAGNTITQKYNVDIQGSTTNHAATLDMPDYSSNIMNMGYTTFKPGKKNSPLTTINGNVYVDGDVTINSALVNITGAVMAEGDINVTALGVGQYTSNDNQLALYSKNGDITITSIAFGDNASSIIYAPNGKVTINSAVGDFHGAIIAKEVQFGSMAMTLTGGFGYKSIPGATGGIFGGGRGAALVQ
jgi:Flp pilus assembly protein TadG